jgi:hypothetical protein
MPRIVGEYGGLDPDVPLECGVTAASPLCSVSPDFLIGWMKLASLPSWHMVRRYDFWVHIKVKY